MDALEMAAEGFIDDTDFDDECHQELYDVEYEVRNFWHFWCVLSRVSFELFIQILNSAKIQQILTKKVFAHILKFLEEQFQFQILKICTCVRKTVLKNSV